jgi:hypothetical protein
LSNVSEVLTASIIRAMIAQIMEAVSTCEMSVNFYEITYVMQYPRMVFFIEGV